jgi:hypothetical protein
MIQKFVNWVRGFCSPSGPTELVFFDGDQVTKAELNQFYRKHTSVEYHWIQVGSVFPRILPKHNLHFHHAPSTGKEATDTKITVMLTHLCSKYKSTLKSVYVVSADGDFVDVLETVGGIFPTIQFAQMINTTRRTNKRVKPTARRLAGTNCSVLFYHPGAAKRGPKPPENAKK